MDTINDAAYGYPGDQTESLPLYTEEECSLTGLQGLIAALSMPCSLHHSSGLDLLNAYVEGQQSGPNGSVKIGAPEPIMEYPDVVGQERSLDEMIRIRQNIVNHFFDAIAKGTGDAIALFINHNLVTANTTNRIKKTPLLAAIATKKLGIVQQLLELGADPNAFGVEACELHYHPYCSTEIKRTPLQLAASIGHLPMVKLLMEVYHANDSLIAPDGQIALRLAAENGHREVVDYLPTRRGGGFRRWQHHHQKAIGRAIKALMKIYGVLKFFFWDIEKFFLWSLPAHLIIGPFSKGCAYCWKNKKFFLPWMSSQIRKIPDRAKRFGKAIWKGLKTVPETMVDMSTAVWKFGTTTLPRWIRKFAMSLWNLLTVRILQAVAIAARWIYDGFASIGKTILDSLRGVLSLLHTMFEAVVTFFQSMTLRDIWNGFYNLLHTVLVSFPRNLWFWICGFSDMSFKFMKKLLGELGEIIWLVFVGTGYLVTYLPAKVWVVLESFGDSFAKGWHEVAIFINPKS